jgi:site-specific recombinase XerD
VTVTQLVKHYTDNELPSKAHSTQRTLETSLNVWITPKWGEHRLSDVRTVEVESWLHALSLANATKAKVRNVMHVIFAHACRHELLQKNPISLVRQSAKRKKTPDVLDAEELKKLLVELQNPARVLNEDRSFSETSSDGWRVGQCAPRLELTAATGLRVSEALGTVSQKTGCSPARR